MTTSTPITTSDERHSAARREFAQQLREVRSACPGRRDELIDWLFMAIPTHRWTRRLKAETLLKQGHADAADAIVAQSMIGRPDDVGLSWLRARCLVVRGELHRADELLRDVLDRRPSHVGAIVLAGCVAGRLSNFDRSVTLLQHAHELRPDDPFIARRLVDRLIDAGRLDQAETMLAYLGEASVAERARLRHRQGRWVESLETVRARLSEPVSDTPDDVLRTYVESLELVDGVEPLIDLAGRIGPSRPQAMLRLLESWLRIGAFELTLREALRLARSRQPGACGQEAWHIVAVAAAMAGRVRLASLSLDRLSRSGQVIDQQRMAGLWRRAMLGQLIAEQGQIRVAPDADDHSVLRPLLREAIAILDRDASSTMAGPEPQGMAPAMSRACRDALAASNRPAA